MSAIHARTVVEALDKPSTLKALVRKTGYPAGAVLGYIVEARMRGDVIHATPRGRNLSREATIYSYGGPSGIADPE